MVDKITGKSVNTSKASKRSKKKPVKKKKTVVKATTVVAEKVSLIKRNDPLTAIKHKGKNPIATIDNPSELGAGSMWLIDAAMAENFSSQTYRRIYSHSLELFLKAGPFLGRRTSIYGNAHMGKSTLAYRLTAGLLRTCLQCHLPAIPWKQSDGSVDYTCKCGANDFYNGILVDTEGSATIDYLKTQGVYIQREVETHSKKGYDVTYATKDVTDAGKLLIFKPFNLDQMYATLNQLLLDGRVQFIVMDTLNSLLPEEQIKKDEEGTRAASARTHWRWLKKLNATQEMVQAEFGYRPTIIWTNHVTANMNFGFGPGATDDQETGGKGVQGFADQRIEMCYTSKNSKKVLSADAKKALQEDVVTQYYFRVVKSKTSILTNKGGTYSIFERTYKSKAGIYKPGMTNEANVIYNLMDSYGLFRAVKKGGPYTCLGMKFRIISDSFDFFNREDIQYECRYWIGRLILPDLARASVLLEDFFYNKDEKEKERVKAFEEEFRLLESELNGDPKKKDTTREDNEEEGDEEELEELNF